MADFASEVHSDEVGGASFGKPDCGIELSVENVGNSDSIEDNNSAVADVVDGENDNANVDDENNEDDIGGGGDDDGDNNVDDGN